MVHPRENRSRVLCGALLAAAWACSPPVSAEEVAAAAAPRQGDGESALIGVAPPREQPLLTKQPAPADQPGALRADPGVWTLPPFRAGGYLAFDWRELTGEGQPRRRQFVESADLRASSYIYEPWFAQVSGELVVIGTQERTQGGPSASGNSLNGGGQLALFPVSRFPFTASYNETDSHASGELINSQYSSRRWSLGQSYMPLGGGASYRLTYDRSDLRSENFGTDKAQALGGSMNLGSASSTFTLNGNRYRNTRSDSGDRSSLDTVYATHSYRPAATSSVESLLNYSDTEYHVESGAVPLDLRSRWAQFNSFATWRPAPTSPLLVNGGARYYQTRTGVAGATTEVDTVSLNLGASYALNRNATLNGAGTVTQASTATGDSIHTQQTAGIDYGSDPIRLGQYFYTWSGGANLGNQTGGERDRQNGSARIGHRVNRNFAVRDDSMLFLNFNQGYAVTEDTVLSGSRTLINGAGASWSRRAGEAGTTLLALDAFDSRTEGYGEQHFTLVNLQASGQMLFSRWASGGANLTIQYTRNTVPFERSNTAGGGNLNYQHLRAFGVPALRYYALLNINQQRDRTRLDGDINASMERVAWAFEQRLEHVIGRLETRLSMRFAEIDGRRNGLVLLRILRRFGDL